MKKILAKKILAVLSAAAVLAAAVVPANADGWRRHWRGHRYGVGMISRNVITPYYYPYYGYPGYYAYPGYYSYPPPY